MPTELGWPDKPSFTMMMMMDHHHPLPPCAAGAAGIWQVFVHACMQHGLAVDPSIFDGRFYNPHIRWVFQ
jgi:hypothetical protein